MWKTEVPEARCVQTAVGQLRPPAAPQRPSVKGWMLLAWLPALTVIPDPGVW